MSYVIYAWLAAILYGLTNVIGKLTSKYTIKNFWLFNFLFALFSLIFTIPLAIKNNVGIPISWENLILSAVFNALFLIFYILSFYHLDVTVMSPLFNFRTVFAVLLSFIILREVLTFNQIVFIILIIFAGFFVSLDEKFNLKSFFRKSVLYGLLMALFLALTGIYINKAVADTGYWETNLFNPLITQIILLFTLPLFYKEVFKINIKQIGSVGIAALCIALGNISANLAYASNVSISTSIISLPFSMFIVFLVSLFKPDLLEKHSLKVYAIRFAAAFIMIFSALRISG
ncbi:EamA family transporter [Candidatus Woesearchaeota archaeon]|nr:EamA family transporter [Candidatus Woesearchaeota archaeon]